MRELGELVQHRAEFEALGVQLVALSVDPPDRGVEVRDRLHVPFPVLSDSAQAVMGLYGTQSPEYKNRLGISVNTPTLILVDGNGIIRWIHQAEDFRVRPTVAEDLAAARRALR